MSEQKLKTDKDGIPIDDPSMRGWSRYFNNCTIRGRANLIHTKLLLLAIPTLQVAKTTLTLMLVGTVYYRFLRPKNSTDSGAPTPSRRV